MALQHVRLDQIDETQLQRLVDAKAAETRDIEYKRDIYGNTDKDHSEFLADVSSFANTSGGDIVIGMMAENGIATAFRPIAAQPDAEILRLESIARSGLQPRIPQLSIRSVPIREDGFVLIVRIPRSYNSPHRVIRQGTGQNRFWARSSAGKYEPNVDELRLLFTRAPLLADRIREFRFDRIAKIAANQAVTPLVDRHALVIHVVPFSAFDSRISLPLDRANKWYMSFPPPNSSYASNFRVNVDGLVTLTSAEVNPSAHKGYVQVFHSGIVEAVASSFLNRDRAAGEPGRLTAIRTESCIVKSSCNYLRALLSFGSTPPFVLLVSLIGVQDVLYSFVMGNSIFEDEAGHFDRDQFHFAEVIIDDVAADPCTHAKALRPLLDEIANAAGRPFTPTFDQDGKFKGDVD